VDVACAVGKGGTILSLSPDRTLVKKGDLVCELDASELIEKAEDLGIAVQRAQADYQFAKANHELAELAVKEYLEGKYINRKAAILSKIKLAESELARASDRIDRSTRSYEKGTLSKAQKVVEELSYQKVKFDLELAQQELNLYENFSKARDIKQLKAAAVKAAADEAVSQAVLELARVREQRTRRQIEECRLRAPCDGRVVPMMRPALAGEGQDPVPIREGDRVRERQVIFRIIPPSP
jgi:HlyD family secretion protein